MKLKKIFSPEDWINVRTKAIPTQLTISNMVNSNQNTDNYGRVDGIVTSLEHYSIDITNGYDN